VRVIEISRFAYTCKVPIRLEQVKHNSCPAALPKWSQRLIQTLCNMHDRPLIVAYYRNLDNQQRKSGKVVMQPIVSSLDLFTSHVG
jgi:type IV pilus biogenesis protein CpaD/CtpE